LTLRDKQIILAKMKRVKLGGDFRSNVSLGAEAEPVELTPEQEQIALKTAQLSKLPWCAVDIMPLVKGSNPEIGDNVVLEINASPGTDGISEVIKENFVNVLLHNLQDPSLFYLQDKVAGFIEAVTVKFDEAVLTNEVRITLVSKPAGSQIWPALAEIKVMSYNELKFDSTKLENSLVNEEKKEISLLHEYIAKGGYNLDELNTQLYAIPKAVFGEDRPDKELKGLQGTFFKNVYRLLIDKESGMAHLKTADNMGQSATQLYKFEAINADGSPIKPQEPTPQFNPDDFAKKFVSVEQYQELVNRFEELKKFIGGKQNVGQPKQSAETRM
jgi:hypothetical protein